MKKILLIVLMCMGVAVSQDEPRGYNLAKHREIAIDLTESAADFFSQADVAIPRACHDFQRNEKW
ncbi:MAG TPA: hypothetical protein VHA52_12220, partial [Candidatus Babeliaceae bacterium]|nr:hypothetical protein [Candidatus Babeliaceae bacterium]